MPARFTGIPGTKASTPGTFTPGAVYYAMSADSSLLFAASRWQGGVGTGLSFEGTEYILVPISVTYTNGYVYDPTADVVQFAFIGPYATTQQAADYPPTTSTVWTAGAWNPDAETSTAQILVGPAGGALALAVGSYQVWVKIIDSPEIPVLWCGPMVVS